MHHKERESQFNEEKKVLTVLYHFHRCLSNENPSGTASATLLFSRNWTQRGSSVSLTRRAWWRWLVFVRLSFQDSVTPLYKAAMWLLQVPSFHSERPGSQSSTAIEPLSRWQSRLYWGVHPCSCLWSRAAAFSLGSEHDSYHQAHGAYERPCRLNAAVRAKGLTLIIKLMSDDDLFVPFFIRRWKVEQDSWKTHF